MTKYYGKLIGVALCIGLLNSCCDEITCFSGSFDKSKCECNCEPGWEGKDCSSKTHDGYLYAELAYSDGNSENLSLSKDLDHFEVNFLRGIAGKDTIEIDAFRDDNYYFFFRVFTDINALSLKKSNKFPISNSQMVGTAWCTHNNKPKYLQLFQPSSIADTLYIDNFDESLNLIEAHFNTVLSNSDKTVTVTKGSILNK